MDAQATFSCSFTQSDLGPVTELPSGPPAELPSFPHWPAQRLLPLGACLRIKSIGSKHLCHCLIWQTVVFPENSKIAASAIRRKSLSGFT